MLIRLLLFALFLPFGSSATAPATQAAVVDHARLFEAAAQEVDVPPELTQAIARVESGGTPYALNIEGRGYFFDNKAEAVAAAEQAQSLGQSFDSGIMQINNWWLKRYGIPLDAVFDPAANIFLGSWILKQEIDRAGDTWTAVARYHSPDSGRGGRYADLVRQALAKGPSQTTATTRASRPGSLVHSKEKETARPAPKPDPKTAAAPLVVYRGATRSVFTRVPAAALPGPESEPAAIREQSSSSREQELLAEINQEQAKNKARVFVRRFQ